MDTSYEIVYTVTDYYDGPRGGVANYHGQPHVYHAEDENSTRDHRGTFVLMPIDTATFHLALEDWELWVRWHAAFHAGTTTLDTHPALPEDRARHTAIQQVLAPKLYVDPQLGVRVRGAFQPRAAAGWGIGIRPLQVQWETLRG